MLPSALLLVPRRILPRVLLTSHCRLVATRSAYEENLQPLSLAERCFRGTLVTARAAPSASNYSLKTLTVPTFFFLFFFFRIVQHAKAGCVEMSHQNFVCTVKITFTFALPCGISKATEVTGSSMCHRIPHRTGSALQTLFIVTKTDCTFY